MQHSNFDNPIFQYYFPQINQNPPLGLLEVEMLDVLKLVYILNPSQRVSHRLNQVPTNLGNNMYDIHCIISVKYNIIQNTKLIQNVPTNLDNNIHIYKQYEYKMYTRCRWGICNCLIDLGFFG